jgi:YbbR domain-containing protein
MLWFGILSRRDYVLIQRVDLDIKVATQSKIIAQTADFIKLRVSGPRTELKKFMDRTQELSIDISDRGIGLIDVDIPIYKIETPPGVKILGVKPNLIRVEVAPN